VSYLSIVENVIKDLVKKYNINSIVISNLKYENKNFIVENIEWNKKNEIEDLRKIDIGIYPVNDEEWSYGKSGLKALQHMGLGIPTVASDILTTRDILKNNYDGILVKNDYDSWLYALERLILDNEFRRNIGLNGFNKVTEFYTKHAIRKKYFKLLLS
jgi:Glycosyltransferase